MYRPLPLGDSNGTKGHSLKLCHGTFRLDISRNFFMQRVVRPWEVLECPSLKMSKESLDMALTALGW